MARCLFALGLRAPGGSLPTGLPGSESGLSQRQDRKAESQKAAFPTLVFKLLFFFFSPLYVCAGDVSGPGNLPKPVSRR